MGLLFRHKDTSAPDTMCTVAEQGHLYQVPVYRSRSKCRRLFSEDMALELWQLIQMSAHTAMREGGAPAPNPIGRSPHLTERGLSQFPSADASGNRPQPVPSPASITEGTSAPDTMCTVAQQAKLLHRINRRSLFLTVQASIRCLCPAADQSIRACSLKIWHQISRCGSK